MVRKASRKPGPGSAAVTPSTSSSPRSNATSNGQRRSARANEMQSTTRRASLLYQVYDSSSVSGATATTNTPSPSHAAAVVAAAAVLANPTGQAPPPPTSNISGQPGGRGGGGGGGGRHASAVSGGSGGNGNGTTTAASATRARNVSGGSPSAANARAGIIQHTTSDDTVLPRPFAKGGSYANENPRLIVSDPLPLPTTTTSTSMMGPTASPSSATFRSRVTKKSEDAAAAPRRKSSSRSLPRDASQLSSESGASARSGTSASRPRALSLPRTHESGGSSEVLPRLRPVRGGDALTTCTSASHVKSSPRESLRPSPPPPPAGGGGGGAGAAAAATPSTSNAGSATHSRAVQGDGDVGHLREVLSAPSTAFAELTKSTSPQQAQRRNRERNAGGADANGRARDVPESANGAATRSPQVTASPAALAKNTVKQVANNDDDDDDNWGDPENSPEDASGHLFSSTQLLSSLRPHPKEDHATRPNPLPAAAGGGPANAPQHPRQPAVPAVARPHLSSPPAPECSPAYKFNVVLSSGKASTVPIALIAGSGCVQGMRPTMEDAHFIELNATHVRGQPVSLMAVLDGHCGRRVADLGAKWLPHYVLHHAALGENNALALVESILQTDREIFHVLQAKKNELEQQRKAGRNTGRRRRDVYEEMLDETTGANGGSTLITAAVCGRMLYVACLGDARAVLYDGQTTIAMSEDHKPGNAEESRRISKCGGFVQFGRVCGILAVSRALGDFEFKFQPSSNSEEEGLLIDFPFGAQRDGGNSSESVAAAAAAATASSANAGATSSQPASQANRRFISNRDLMVSNVADVRQLNLTDASAFLLLACDGLWDVLSNEEATEFVRDFLSYTPDVCDPRILSGEKPRPTPDVIRRVLNNCCQKLTEFAVDRGSMDNVSAMVLFFHDVVDTVARFNGRAANSANNSSVMSGTSSRGARARPGRGSVQPSPAGSNFELTNNQVKVRNGRVVARH